MQASAIELAHIAERSRKCQEIELALIAEPQPILLKTSAVCVPHDTVCLRHCGGLKAQLLPIAQGSALGKRYALIKVSRSVRAAFIMRGNAPWHCLLELRARGAWHFCASAKMPNVLIAEYVHPGRCPGLWATIGLSARPIFFSQPQNICQTAPIVLLKHQSPHYLP